MQSIAQSASRPAHGFDYLRLLLAVGVMAFHSVPLCQGDIRNMPETVRLVAALILPMFFALSGFLVTGSLITSRTVGDYVLLRLLRVVPALCAVVLVTALIMGPLVSSLPPSRYFADPQLPAYLTNMLGDAHYQLPGVFTHNPRSGVVNGSLWTIGQEFACYLVLALLLLAGALRRPWLYAVGVLAACAAASWWPLLLGPLVPSLVLCFFAGAALRLAGAHIPLHAGLFAVALMTAFLLMRPGAPSTLAAFPVAYATVWLGLRRLPPLPGDYSYGLYLVGYPLQQLYAWLFPDFRVWWANGLFALGIGLVLAVLSWRFIEKPVLLRKHEIIARLRGWLTWRRDDLASRKILGRPSCALPLRSPPHS